MVFSVQSTSAQVGYKPFVPQFSVKIIESVIFDDPPYNTTVVDPSTGQETIVTLPGFREINRTIEISIKNQPFTSYTDASNNKHELHYMIEFTEHSEENWQTFYPSRTANFWGATEFIIQADFEYTIVYGAIYDIAYLKAGSQLDFRVQAAIGYVQSHYEDNIFPAWYEFITDTKSNWSVQTLTISTEPSQTYLPSQIATIFPPITPDGDSQPYTLNQTYVSGQTYTPDKTYASDSVFLKPFDALIIGIILGGVITLVVFVFLRRGIKTSTNSNYSPVKSE
jgi:hypothetical protein